ncbi:Serine protease, subtilisin family [Gracilibacillus ureilyticus]|uniref:Serine protease, subtilisin family n=1 Tax=Gracilibacillus ureilyticus TaxID=531814 RepID=A0A1H9RBS7_9BACI|nr:S8 family serine peptidase [Gracilibacillus ureilyticus]SER70140.1 Serine protease, subtilisin family [Gracilibacillus ureilyticus]
MKKLYFIIALFLLITSNSLEVMANDTKESPDKERIIVGFDQTIDLHVLDGIPYELHHMYESIQAISISLPSQYRDMLSEIEEVDWTETDQLIKTNIQFKSWGNAAINSKFYEQNGITGKDVKVGVIDTGIKQNHPDLNVSGGISFIEGTSSYEDDNGHGTHVAGIIAGLDNEVGVVGVAPDVNLYAIKSLDINGEGRQADIMAGIEWAIEQELDIINLSVTTPIPSISLKKAVDAADEAGILVVASSGNAEEDGQVTDDVLFPARFSNVISVGSVNNQLRRSEFSYQGPSLQYVAPGEDILSTYFEEPDYVEMSGTSMAAPYVTGILALYKEVYPNIDKNSLMKIINSNVEDLGAKGRDDEYGYGLIQAPDSWFWDIDPSIWFADYVYFLRQSNYIGGYPDGTYKADNQITRGEAATIIGTVLDLDGTKRLTDFSDVKQDYFASGYIASLSDANIVSGYPDQTFMPARPITRGEAAVIIQSAFQIQINSKDQFNDVDESQFYEDAVNDLAELDIISGYPSGKFKPDNQITRAEFSVILGRLLNEEMRN